MASAMVQYLFSGLAKFVIEQLSAHVPEISAAVTKAIVDFLTHLVEGLGSDHPVIHAAKAALMAEPVKSE